MCPLVRACSIRACAVVRATATSAFAMTSLSSAATSSMASYGVTHSSSSDQVLSTRDRKAPHLWSCFCTNFAFKLSSGITFCRAAPGRAWIAPGPSGASPPPSGSSPACSSPSSSSSSSMVRIWRSSSSRPSSSSGSSSSSSPISNSAGARLSSCSATLSPGSSPPSSTDGSSLPWSPPSSLPGCKPRTPDAFPSRTSHMVFRKSSLLDGQADPGREGSRSRRMSLGGGVRSTLRCSSQGTSWPRVFLYLPTLICKSGLWRMWGNGGRFFRNRRTRLVGQ
mmetsp:Transcript_8563/g.25473  ORF Transcript_8563/g.25473 Transcript_8563/m.25473 type:complete len:280 (-) Transcript_8563:40-879(-)